MEIPFLQENKNVGLLLLISGLITILGGILLVALRINYHVSGWYLYVAIIAMIIAIISGLLYILAGLSVRDSKDDQFGLFPKLAAIVSLKIEYDIKVGVPAFIFLVMGVTMILSGIVSIFALDVFGILIGFILGIFYVLSAPMVAGQNKPDYAKIFWLVLVILTLVFGIILALVGAILSIGAGVWGIAGVLSGIVTFIIALYLLLALLSDDIKNNMGADYF